MWKSLACVGIALFLYGCDTTAELTFLDEQLIEVVPQGLVSASCRHDVDVDADGTFRFSVITSLDRYMLPGRQYSALSDVLVPGKNFSAGNIMFSDGWIFVVDTAGEDMTCGSSSECPRGASCLSPSEMGLDQYHYSPQKYCVYQTKVEVVSGPEFTHFNRQVFSHEAVHGEKKSGRTISFLLDNSATLDGSDVNGVPDDSRATDPWQFRKVGLNQFMEGLSMTEETFPRYQFSAHYADGMGEAGVVEATEGWLKTEAAWNKVVMDKYPSPAGGSPIWEAGVAALTKMQDADPSYTRTLIAITDGAPNEGTESAFEEFRRLMLGSEGMDLHWVDFEPGEGKFQRAYSEMVGMGCGSYFLFNNPFQFSKTMRAIAFNSESHWDVGLKFSAQLPEGNIYRLASDIVIEIGSSAVSYQAQRVTEQSETMDYRLVFSK